MKLKKMTIYIYLLMHFSILGTFFTGCEKCIIDPDEKAVNKVMARNSKVLAKKYHMRPIGIGVAMPGGDIQCLDLEFQIHGPLPKDDIRKILINAAHDFLADINSDEELCYYLKNNSFSIENIEVVLFFIDSSGKGLNDPDIGIAEISKGKLTFMTLTTTDIRKIKTKCYETYEEAVRRVTDA